MTVLIINGGVVHEDGMRKETIVIRDGIIEALTSPSVDLSGKYRDAEIIDAAGQYVVPGGVDGHVHFGGFGDVPIADDFVTGSRAALAGGTTTVVDFAEPAVGEDPVKCVERRIEEGKDSMVDYAFHFVMTEEYPKSIPRLDEIQNLGITAFKAFTYYPNTSLLPGDFLMIMEKIHDRGTLLVHCEEKSIIDRMREQFPPEESGYEALSLTRPNIAEQLAVENVLALAKLTGIKLCIAHTSSAETMDIKMREMAEGNRNFFLETCPHYMCLTREQLKGSEGGKFTMNPPLRSQEDCERIMEGLVDGEIDIVSTDHCPYLTKYKLDPSYNYQTVPCGVDGIQTRMEYIFSESVMKRGMPLERFVSVTSANAARFYNLYPRKGTIAPGSDADLAFFDPAVEWTYTKEAIQGAADYTVFEGLPLRGKCVRTIKGGKVVWKDGRVTAEKGSGRFLRTDFRIMN